MLPRLEFRRIGLQICFRALVPAASLHSLLSILITKALELSFRKRICCMTLSISTRTDRLFPSFYKLLSRAIVPVIMS